MHYAQKVKIINNEDIYLPLITHKKWKWWRRITKANNLNIEIISISSISRGWSPG